MLTPNQVVDIVKANAPRLNYNEQIIDIFEGNISKYLIANLKDTLSAQSFEYAMKRMAPINILPKIIDKLTNIYQTPVLRKVMDGTDQDQELLKWYETQMHANDMLNSCNELYNLAKSTLIQPYVNSKGIPQLRAILNDRFVVFSDNPEDPLTPTHVIILAGKKRDLDCYWVYTDNEIWIQNSRGDIEQEEMAKYGMDGSNPVGRIPFVYVNQSKYRLIPKQDLDIVALCTLIPAMITDLNLAAMFQSFSITYGINLDGENMKMAPNAFWFLKSDNPGDGTEPKIGTIKPQVDFNEVLSLAQAELSMWLQSKGIKANSVGQLTQDNFASGISKLIDEMDTYEAREKQATTFQTKERELWDLILNAMHPYWYARGMISNSAVFTPSAYVQTEFSSQIPNISRGELVKDLQLEVASGFTTREQAIKRLNPEFTDEQVEDLMEDIDEERGILIDTSAESAGDNMAGSKNGSAESDNSSSKDSQAGSTQGVG